MGAHGLSDYFFRHPLHKERKITQKIQKHPVESGSCERRLAAQLPPLQFKFRNKRVLSTAGDYDNRSSLVYFTG